MSSIDSHTDSTNIINLLPVKLFIFNRIFKSPSVRSILVYRLCKCENNLGKILLARTTRENSDRMSRFNSSIDLKTYKLLSQVFRYYIVWGLLVIQTRQSPEMRQVLWLDINISGILSSYRESPHFTSPVAGTWLRLVFWLSVFGWRGNFLVIKQNKQWPFQQHT